MASALYPSFKELLLGGGVDLTTDVVRALLIDTGAYTFSSAHDFRNDISGVVGTPSAALSSKTITAGVFDADNTVVESVSSESDDIEAVVLYIDVGSSATDHLICFLDGLDLQPNGNNININWHASGIFAL